MRTSLRFATLLFLVSCVVAFAQTPPPPPAEDQPQQPPASDSQAPAAPQETANIPPPPADNNAPPDNSAAVPPPPADTTAQTPPPPAADQPAAPAETTVASRSWHPVPDRRWNTTPPPAAQGEAMMARPGYSPFDHRPDLEIKGRLQGADLVLQFPPTTLPYTVSFKVPGALNVTPHRLADSGSIRWNSSTELAVNMDLLKNNGADLNNLWVWGQLREGDALMQRVHVQQ